MNTDIHKIISIIPAPADLTAVYRYEGKDHEANGYKGTDISVEQVLCLALVDTLKHGKKIRQVLPMVSAGEHGICFAEPANLFLFGKCCQPEFIPDLSDDSDTLAELF